LNIVNLNVAGGVNAIYSTAGNILTFTTSSIRYKENIEDYENTLDRVMALRPIRFQWKKDTGSPGVKDIGFTVEDVAPLFPDLVTYEEDGVTLRGVKYDKIPVLLVRAIQEQQRQIEAMRAALKTLGVNA
jgi:hypothetical protein